MLPATGLVVAMLVASLLTASLMTALVLPGLALPWIFAASTAALIWFLRPLARNWRQPPLERLEWALLAYALAIGLLRLAPYAYQYTADVLVAPVTWDDNWHFQEVASLVNAERFPPLVNFQPTAHLHFYYIPWVPAAALSSLALQVTGVATIKLGYALGALALELAIAWTLIMVARHVLEAPARPWALTALLVAGAAIDGLFALRYLAAIGEPVHAEWWQLNYHVRNSYSSLTSSLVWVPHHLIGGLAMLLAVVLTTQPRTLAPSGGLSHYLIAGLLISCAAFSSIFAFIGGVVALSPLLYEMLAREHRARLGWLVAGFLVPALPLAYIYLASDARAGFELGHAFSAWHEQHGSIPMGIVGLLAAAAMMILEVGWLYAAGRLLDPVPRPGDRLRLIAVASSLLLATTVIIGFSGSNNWALRATIVPVLALALYVGRGAAQVVSSEIASKIEPAKLVRIGTIALALAGLAHLNEFALLVRSSLASPTFQKEDTKCKIAIIILNRGGGNTTAMLDKAACKDLLSAYHIERRFQKRELSREDRELMGQGPIILPRGR